MCIKLSVDGFGGSEESSQAHLVNSLDEDDIHSALVQVQQELFEEEIFAEVGSCESFSSSSMLIEHLYTSSYGKLAINPPVSQLSAIPSRFASRDRSH